MKSILYSGPLALFVASGWACVAAQAQLPAKAAAADPTRDAKGSLSLAEPLAERGKCKEALQLLRKAPRTADKDLRLKAGVATVRCAMGRDETEAAIEAILLLNREFPNDPEVLYITTHAYSDLSTKASLELARTSPDSYQAHEMNAEALELQGKWDDAAREYEAILKQDQNVPGIHFRMARLYLSRPGAEADAAEKAKKELESELEIDPRNAVAEYLLGELAREATQWDEAIGHFSRSEKLDPSFADAFLGLGMSDVSAGKFTEAIGPLETYVKMQPANPAGHYQLAVAYSRTGRMEDAKREAALQKAAAAKIQQEQEKGRNTDAAQKPAAGQEVQKPEFRR